MSLQGAAIKVKARTRGDRPGSQSRFSGGFSAESRRRIDGVMAKYSSKSVEVVPAMTDSVIFKDILSGHRRTEAEGERSSAVEFLVCK